MAGGPKAAAAGARGAEGAARAARDAWHRAKADRQAYVDDARNIAETGRARVANGEDPEVVARESVQARNDLKVRVRNNGPWLLKKGAELRNWLKYKNTVGKSYEQYRSERRSDLRIIDGSGKTNRRIDRLLGVR